MKNKKNIILVVSFVVLALISFYAGAKFSVNKKSTQFPQNFNSARGQMGGQNQGGMRINGGNIFGKVISKDANSITVELQNGANKNDTTVTGSKIIFFSDKTNISKTATGNISDLTIGTNINVSGTTNPDGSVSATSVQIR
jgi:hypothetical protein